jgi:hypothetical protein
MTKLGTAFWIGLVLASGFTTFKVKHAVQDIDDQLIRTRKYAIAEQQEIRVLAAEWTYLNQPERLAELNRTFLQLGPIATKQLQQRIEDIPWRATVAEPDMLVAASAPAVVPHAAVPPAAVPPAAAPRAALTPIPAPIPAPTAPIIATPVPGGVPAGSGAANSLRLAKAVPGSLDALIAQIADTR